jgi:hypothetical protein
MPNVASATSADNTVLKELDNSIGASRELPISLQAIHKY